MPERGWIEGGRPDHTHARSVAVVISHSSKTPLLGPFIGTKHVAARAMAGVSTQPLPLRRR